MKFNSKKSGSWEGGKSWKIGEKIMKAVEEFMYLGVWLDWKLQGNVCLQKMNKADE